MSQENNTLSFTESVFQQFDEVRAEGECNMMDRACVGAQAMTKGFYELLGVTTDKIEWFNLCQEFADWVSQE